MYQNNMYRKWDKSIHNEQNNSIGSYLTIIGVMNGCD